MPQLPRIPMLTAQRTILIYVFISSRLALWALNGEHKNFTCECNFDITSISSTFLSNKESPIFNLTLFQTHFASLLSPIILFFLMHKKLKNIVFLSGLLITTFYSATQSFSTPPPLFEHSTLDLIKEHHCKFTDIPYETKALNLIRETLFILNLIFLASCYKLFLAADRSALYFFFIFAGSILTIVRLLGLIASPIHQIISVFFLRASIDFAPLHFCLIHTTTEDKEIFSKCMFEFFRLGLPYFSRETGLVLTIAEASLLTIQTFVLQLSVVAAVIQLALRIKKAQPPTGPDTFVSPRSHPTTTPFQTAHTANFPQLAGPPSAQNLMNEPTAVGCE